MKDWKEKSLSQAGKETLIKAVIQAIPTYSMNCFLLPITTCQDIERATARFFWNSTLEERKSHWAAWDILTTPKAKDGIGFKELHFFNIAMLAKQVWTLLQNPDSLAYRILKAKYFPRSDLLQARVGFKPSYLWRSLMAAQEIVKEGEAWRVGNGKSIHISDRWIGVQQQERPRGRLHEDIHHEKVCALIDHQSSTWRADMMAQYFQADELERIKAIPLSTTDRPDRRLWRFSKHGFFTVKSAYHTAVAKLSRLHEDRATTSNIATQWQKLWRIEVIPRVRMFLWRACVNVLPTRANLNRRGNVIDPRCPLYGDDVEDVEHLFLRCSRTYAAWYLSPLRINMESEKTSSFKEFLWEKVDNFPKEYVELLPYTAWEI